jgi:chromosome segregation ATPase
MDFFTIGNFLTLGIVAVVLVLYRQLDRRNRGLDKVRKYADRLNEQAERHQEELAAFVAKQEEAVKDYGISLEVQQKSAKELMNRLHMTDEEMAAKAAAIAKIDERITAYDASLEELVRMTARVQENLNRIREESAFVEQVNKRVSEAKDKFGSIEKDIKNLEKRFERDNADSLKKAADGITVKVQSTLSALRAETETIERLVADNREELDRAEEDRVANVKRDMDIINQTFKQVMEKASNQAEKMEDAALVKLREQALERVQRLQTSIEEGLRAYQESTKAKIAEIQNLVKVNREAWEKNQAELASQQQLYKDTWKQDVQELNGLAQVQRETWTAQQQAWAKAAEDGDVKVRQLLSELETSSKETTKQMLAETAIMEQRLKDVQDYTNETVTALEQRLMKTSVAAEEKVLKITGEQLESWKTITAEADTNTRQLLAALEAAAAAMKTRFTAETEGMEQRLKDLQVHTDEAITALRDHVVKAAEETEVKVLEDGAARLEQWKRAAEAGDIKARQLLAAFETSFAETRQQVSGEISGAMGRIEALQNKLNETTSHIEDTLRKAVNSADQKAYLMADARFEQWKRVVDEGDAKSRQFLTTLETSCAETQRQLFEEIDEAKEQIETLRRQIGETSSHIEDELRGAVEDAEQKASALANRRLEAWNQAVEAGDAKSRELLTVLEASFAATQKQVSDGIAGTEGQIETVYRQIGETTAQIEDRLRKAVEDVEQQASAMSNGRLEAWNQAVEAGDAKSRELLAALEASFAATQKQVSDGIAGAEGQIETVHHQIGEITAQIEARLRKAMEDTEQQASALANGRLEAWNQAVEAGDAKSRELLTALEASFATTQKQVSDGIAGVEGQIETVHRQIGETTAQIEDRLRGAMEDTEQQASAMANGRLEAWNQAVEAGDAKSRELLTALETSFAATQKQVSDGIARAEGQIETVHHQIGETTAQIEDRLRRAMEDTEQQALAMTNGRLEAWSQAAEAGDAKSRELLAAFEASFAETRQQVSGEIAEAARQIETLQHQINETASQIEDGLGKAVEDADQRAMVMADARLEAWNQAVEAGDAKSRELLAAFEASFAETRQQVSGEIAEAAGQIETLQHQINETASRIEDGLRKAVEDAEQKALVMADARVEAWNQAVEAGDAKSRELLAAFEASFAETHQQVSGEIAEAEGQIETLQRQINETASHIEAGLRRAVEDAEQKASDMADAGLEQWKALAEKAEGRTRELLAELETASGETKQSIADAITKADARIREVRSALETAAAETKKNLDDAMTGANVRTRELLAELEAASTETTRNIGNEVAGVEGRFEALHHKIGETASHIETEMGKAVKEAERHAVALADARLEQWKQAVAAGDATAQELRATLEASCGKLQKQVSDEITGAEARFQTLQNQLNETLSHLEGDMRTAVEEAEQRALAMTDTGLEKWKAAAEQADTQARKLLSALETTSAETQKTIADEIAGAGGRFDALKAEINETASHIEADMRRAVEDAKERAQALADTGLEAWKAAADQTNAQARKLLSDLETASLESEKKLTALEQRMITIAGDAERKVLELTDARLENWKTVVAKADASTQELLSSLEASSTEIKTHFTTETAAMEQRLKDVQAHTNEAVAALRQHLAEAVKAVEARVLEDAEARLEKYKHTAEAGDTKAREMLATLEGSFTEIKTHFATEAETMEQRLKDVQAHTDTALTGLEASFAETQKHITEEIAGTTGQLDALRNRIDEAASHIEDNMGKAVEDAQAKLEHHLVQAVEAIEQQVLEGTDAKLEEYRTAQAQQFKRLETLADDTSLLDEELRRYMQDTENRVRQDFVRFEQDTANIRETVAAEFTASTKVLKAEIDGVEQVLAVLKDNAYEDVSEKFRRFEDDFSTDLGKRGEDINRRFMEWQASLDGKLANLAEDFKEQLNQNIAAARNTTDASVKAEIEGYARTVTDTLTQRQQDLEGQLKTIADQVAGRNNEISGILDGSRRNIEEWQSGFTTQLHDLDATMNEAQQHAQELIAESDERLKGIRSAIDDAHTEMDTHRRDIFAHIDEHVKQVDATIKDVDQRIKEFINQTNLFERADELRLSFEQRITDLRGDFDRLDQRRDEAAEMEGQFIKIKRLEDEVNAKMTRFFSEKHRIEQMEADFNRLLQTSKAVEEKLVEVSSSDDTIQAVQVQLRQLNDALEDAGERYQRIERKNQTLEITTEGIDRNFKSLQESEKTALYITDELHRIADEMNAIHSSISILSGENEKARETTAKLSLLDKSLVDIEERIAAMQVARKWLAETETRLGELNQQAKDQVKLMGTLMKDGGEVTRDKGAPPIGVRETIVKLAGQGWSVEEIARAVKRSRGEVELILEITPKE